MKRLSFDKNCIVRPTSQQFLQAKLPNPRASSSCHNKAMSVLVDMIVNCTRVVYARTKCNPLLSTPPAELSRCRRSCVQDGGRQRTIVKAYRMFLYRFLIKPADVREERRTGATFQLGSSFRAGEKKSPSAMIQEQATIQRHWYSTLLSTTSLHCVCWLMRLGL